MKKIYFATGNNEKFAIAQAYCAGRGVTLKQASLDITEIQSKQPEIIAIGKATKAFEQLNAPVIVGDDSWAINALRGFPGAYMRYIDEWLTADDVLRLMEPYDDRSGTLTSMLAFTHGTAVQTFRHDHPFTLAREARGSYGKAVQKLVCLPEDNGLTVAEFYDTMENAANLRPVTGAWEQFCDWILAQETPAH